MLVCRSAPTELVPPSRQSRMVPRRLSLIVVCLPAFLAAQERTTVGGYGEIHYTNRTGPNSPGQVNLRRFVLYLAHTFDDRLAFRSALAVEDSTLCSVDRGCAVGLYLSY